MYSPSFKVGDVLPSKSYGLFRITSIINSKNIGIQFIDTGYESTVQAHAVLSGAVKDPYVRSVYGVGYIGNKYPSSINKKMVREYVTWKEVLRRNYDEKHLERFPTYRGCTVCERWHSYENFYEDIKKLEGYDAWLKNDPNNKYSLDKDMLSTTEKIYSPETCKFVPVVENTRFSICKNY